MTTSAEQEREFDLSVLRCAAGTDVGMRRDENQDSFGIIKRESFHGYFVADGMGGVHGGAVASRLAISVLEELLSQGSAPVSCEVLTGAVKAINSRIFEKGSSDPNLAGMGTTIVGLVFTPHGTVTINVGDSRAYRVRGGNVVQLSEDHTLVRELLKSGAISEEQAENHPVSHMLTRSLGPLADVQVDCRTLPEWPEVGDVYLLCSDGLYNFVTEQEMLEVVRQNPLDDANQILINLANQRGGADNITVVVVSVGDLAGKGRTAAYRKARDASGQMHTDIPPHLELPSSEALSDEIAVKPGVTASSEEATAATPSISTDNGHLDNGHANGSGVQSNPAFDGGATVEPAVVMTSEAAFEATVDATVQQSPPVVEISDPEFIPDEIEDEGFEHDTHNGVDDGAATQSKPPPVQEPRPFATIPEEMRRSARSPHPARSRFSPMIAVVFGALVVGPIVGGAVRHFIGEGEPHPAAVPTVAPRVDVAAVINTTTNSNTLSEALKNDGAATATSPEPAAVDRKAPPPSQIEDSNTAFSDNGSNATDRERILKTKEMFEGSIKRVESQLAAFDQPDSHAIQASLVEARKQADELQGKLAEIEQQIDAASRKLSQWYQRQKRLESQDAIKLAAEVGASSPEVQKKKADLEAVTYQFISTRDQFDLYPSNEKLREQLAQITERRGQLLAELRDEVRKAVEGVLSSTDKQLEELKFQRDMLNIQLGAVKQDLEVAKSLAEPDSRERQLMRSKLEQKRQGLKASLVDLEGLLANLQPEQAAEPQHSEPTELDSNE